MTDEDYVSHFPPPRYPAVDLERAAARQMATVVVRTDTHRAIVLRACQADACAQGRMVCPTPAACRLPEGPRTGCQAPRPDTGGRWMMVVIVLLTALAIGSAIWAGV